MSGYYEINIDLAIEYVKKIYVNNLCALCDKSDFRLLRFICGHSACENCITTSVGCYICLTPLELSTFAKPVYDAVLTQQVKNACHLLDAFQKTFNIDVYERKRKSDLLKIEKDVFPQCIQAPLKYYNKRKSYNNSYTGKENYLSQFPGEIVSPVKNTTMENSVNYVTKWLNKSDKNLKRKPLADINLDNANIKRQAGKLNQQGESTLKIKSYENKQRKGGKRFIKTANSLVESQNTLDKFLATIKSKKKSKDLLKQNEQYYKSEIKGIDRAQENNESGIVIDEDTPILIEDSQLNIDYDKPLFNKTVGKEKNTLLAILDSAKNENDSGFVNKTTSSEVGINKTNENVFTDEFHHQYKVPYYKMSYLQENWLLCSKDISFDNKSNNASKGLSKKVDLTLGNRSFTASIKVFNNMQTLKKNDIKKSIPVQTDISNIYDNYEIELDKDPLKNMNIFNKQVLTTTSFEVQSQELFTAEDPKELLDIFGEHVFNEHNTKFEKNEHVIIEESDSSEDMEESRVLEVTADIHRSCEQFPKNIKILPACKLLTTGQSILPKGSEYDILTEVENIEEHEHRPRRRPRGHTPESSNSSDKENFDPNRSKRSKNSKKSLYKK